MAEIVLDGVDKIYGGNVKAVNDLNLNIEDGEFMVLVGPSGCGKSTALRMIAGLEEISGGTLLIGDEVVNDRPPKDRDIAMVFQNYALYPHMSVEQNLAFGLKLRKVSKAEIARRVGEAAEMLGLEPYLKRKPGALSGGQRQRVAMGRAIVREPRAFLMDEPLSNLDAKLRVQMRASLNQLHERLGVTTVYVTHDQIEAMTLGDRVAVILDAGPTGIGLESTIVGLIDETPRLLRSGGVPRDAIEAAIGRPLATPAEASAPVAPGMLRSHYAPAAHVRLNAETVRPGEALLAFGEPLPAGADQAAATINLSRSGDLGEAAARLFSALRELDGTAATIAVAPIPDHGLGEAINDRLTRAAAPRG